MLDIFKFVVVCLGCISSCFCAPVSANPLIIFATQEDPIDILREQAKRMEESSDLHELVKMIFLIREHIVSEWGYFPRLTDILESCRTSLIEDGFEIDDFAFDTLRAEFEIYDDRQGFPTHQMRHKHKKHGKNKKEIKISSKMACGFVKFIGGTLLCFVPVPAVQGAGASLAIVGVSEMVDAARQESDKKDYEGSIDANRRINALLEQQ